MKRWGLLGAGAMGSALIYGAIKSKAIAADNITVYDTVADRAKAMSLALGVNTAACAAEAARESDIIILATKPTDARIALHSIGDAADGKLVVSIALGLTIDAVRGMTRGDIRCVRVMPNTPAMVGEGVSCVSFDERVTDDDKEAVRSLFGSVGMVEVMSESMLSKVTALTGSSPAYAFMFIEAMADGAVHDGVPRAIAYRLAAQALLGSAKMVLDTNRHPAELKDNVCSPAGSTIAAVRSLERSGFRGAVIEAMSACNRRVEELSK